MDADAKKTALRMIPYGIYVLTADDGKRQCRRRDGQLGDADRVQPAARRRRRQDRLRAPTRSSRAPRISPSTCSARSTRASPSPSSSRPRWKAASSPARRSTRARNGAPILDAALAAVECKVTSIVEQGDHHIVVAEVVEAHVPNPISGRLDSAILEMRDLGDNVYYGG